MSESSSDTAVVTSPVGRWHRVPFASTRPMAEAAVVGAISALPVAVLLGPALVKNDSGFEDLVDLVAGSFIFMPYLVVTVGLGLSAAGIRLPFVGGLLVSLAYPAFVIGTAGQGLWCAWAALFPALSTLWTVIAGASRTAHRRPRAVLLRPLLIATVLLVVGVVGNRMA